MALRDTFFRDFGPLLLDSLMISLLDEINELRKIHGLPERELDEFLQHSHDNLMLLHRYDWMEESEIVPP